MSVKTIFLGFLILGGLPSAKAAVELARIGDRVITQDDFNKKYREVSQGNPAGAISKKEFLEELVRREVAVQEAKRQGLDKDPTVSERMNSVLFQALLDKNLAKEIEQIQITDDEAKSLFQKNPEIRTSHIFVALKPNASKEESESALKKIKDVQTKVREGKTSFAELAQRVSESPTAPMGGDVDYQTRDHLDPLYYDAAWALRSPGKVSDVVKTSTGYFLIKLTGVHTWNEVDHGKYKRFAFEQRRAKALERYVDGLRRKAKVTVNADALK